MTHAMIKDIRKKGQKLKQITKKKEKAKKTLHELQDSIQEHKSR